MSKIETKTFKMSMLNYVIRKIFRPKIHIYDFDDTLCLWPRCLRLPNGKILNFNRYMSNVWTKIVLEELNNILPEERHLDYEECSEICDYGFKEHGSSMIGLMEIFPEITTKQLDVIFERVHLHVANHERKGLISWARPNFLLSQAMSNLQTKSYVFTHGSTEYAKIGLKAMGLLNTIIPEENVFGLEMYGYKNSKKTYNAYLWLQQKIGVPFNRMIMSEDSRHNLKTAHVLKMKTVLLHNPDEKGEPFPKYDYVDHTHQTQEDYLWMFLNKGINYTENKLDRSVLESMSENQTIGAKTPYVEALLNIA